MATIQPLLASDRPAISEYLKQYPPEISEHTFTNLFVWRHSRPIHYTILQKSLILLIPIVDQSDNFILFGPPVGEVTLPQVFDTLSHKLTGAVRLPAKSAATVTGKKQPVRDRDNFDYVYSITDLATLAGRRYAKKRNQIKNCLKNYDCRYEPISTENLSECITMQEEWCQARECGHEPGLCSENLAIAELLKHYRELRLFGGAIRVDGRIASYTIGEELCPGTAVCHSEKAMPDIPGLGQLINHWFARHSLQKFTYINREQDMGIPGLRQAKESYYPHHLVEKYTLPLTNSFTERPLQSNRCGV